MVKQKLLMGIVAAASLVPSQSFAQACLGGTPLGPGNRIKVSGSGDFVGGAAGGAGASGSVVGGTDRLFGSLELGQVHLTDTGFVCDAATGQCRTTSYGISWFEAGVGSGWTFGPAQTVSVCPMFAYYRDRPSDVSEVPFSWTSNGQLYSVGVGVGRVRIHSIELRPFVEAGVERLTTTLNYGNQLIGDVLVPTTESTGFVRPGVGVALNRRVSITASVLVPFVADRLVTTSVMASVGFGPH